MPAAWPVIVESGLAEQVLRPARRALGQQHGEERDQPEHRRAIDEHEQDEHERGRGDQHGSVDPAEHPFDVGGEPRAARDVRAHARALDRAGASAQFVDGGHERVLVALRRRR